jgi:hypothetical protein
VTHLAYGRAGLRFVSVLAISGALGCTAGVRATGGTGGTTTTTGAGGSGTGGSNLGTGGGVNVGRGGSVGTGGDVGIMGTGGTPNPDAAACNEKEIPFNPTIPSVFILVDRSGSEFNASNNGTTGTFYTLRTAVEQVIAQLDAKVRFAFGAFVGAGADPSCKVQFTQIPFALNNASTIKSTYDALSFLAPWGSKANTPMSDVIPMIKTLLVADQAAVTGAKYLMIVTDGETDFCDDSSAVCSADAVTYMIQDLYTAGFPTLVVGLPVDMSSGTGDPISGAVLQNFANAGAGQPVVTPAQNPGQTAKPSDIYYTCDNDNRNPSTNTWPKLYAAAGHTAADLTSLATYSTTGGKAPVYSPSAADTTSLVTQISAALNSIPRSCTFDVSGFQGVYTDDLSGAVVYMTDSSGKQTAVPLDTKDSNGWDMINPTAVTVKGTVRHTSSTVQLFGSYCTMLQAQTTVDIKFKFPCEVIIDIN